MSKITSTKLNRAKYRDIKIWGYEMVDGKIVKKKIIARRITGYNPPEERELVIHPKSSVLKALLSIGQRINWFKQSKRQGLNYKLNLNK